MRRGMKMSITKSIFGMTDEAEVHSYILNNGNGLSAEILNYGGIIRRLTYKGVDVVLGRDNISEYFDNNGYYGALVGRNSNRIENSEFELNGKTYNLFANDGRNNLHGGKCGFNSKIWNAQAVDSEEPSLILTLLSHDGEEGFPGNVNVKVTYTLTKDNSIKIHYEGTTDADTVLNMTNHSYFNLNGHNVGTIDSHTLQMNSSFYTPNTDECMPYGEVKSVEGTGFDFRTPKKLSDGFNSGDEQVNMFSGFDHNFALDGRGFRLGAVLKGDRTGITMEMYTDRPAVQLYTGNCIEEGRICKDCAVYTKHSALCLETQAFPNSLKYSHYPNGILRKDEKYDTVTEYKFI